MVTACNDCALIERLVDRHIGLSELYEGGDLGKTAWAPPLLTDNEGKTVADCLSDLADRALAASSNGLAFSDRTVSVLKAAMAQTIADMI